MATKRQIKKNDCKNTLSVLSPNTLAVEDADNMINYKGIYFDEHDGAGYTCPKTGAHFEFNDMCRRVKSIQARRHQYELQLIELSRHDLAFDDERLSAEPSVEVIEPKKQIKKVASNERIS
jgi:hypothetical protein